MSRPPSRPAAEAAGFSPSPGEGITVRVQIYGHTRDTNEPCEGSVVVNVNEDASIEDVLQAAVDYVGSGGWRWGRHGTKDCVADLAVFLSSARGSTSGAPVEIG